MTRSTLWRVLDEADLTPHRCVSWLHSHDPACDAKARDLCALYENALRFSQQGRLVIGVDEKTGRQILQRQYPTQLVQPGKPEKREQEYIRHGVRVWIASFVVPTGQVLWHLGPTRTSADFAGTSGQRDAATPAMTRYDWVARVTSILEFISINHWLPRGQTHPEVMQGTAACHHQITNALLPQTDPVFDDATALHTAVDMRDAQPDAG